MELSKIKKAPNATNDVLLTQDLRLEHVVSYCNKTDKEYNQMKDSMFKGFDTIRKKYMFLGIHSEVF